MALMECVVELDASSRREVEAEEEEEEDAGESDEDSGFSEDGELRFGLEQEATSLADSDKYQGDLNELRGLLVAFSIGEFVACDRRSHISDRVVAVLPQLSSLRRPSNYTEPLAMIVTSILGSLRGASYEASEDCEGVLESLATLSVCLTGNNRDNAVGPDVTAEDDTEVSPSSRLLTDLIKAYSTNPYSLREKPCPLQCSLFILVKAVLRALLPYLQLEPAKAYFESRHPELCVVAPGQTGHLDAHSVTALNLSITKILSALPTLNFPPHLLIRLVACPPSLRAEFLHQPDSELSDPTEEFLLLVVMEWVGDELMGEGMQLSAPMTSVVQQLLTAGTGLEEWAILWLWKRVDALLSEDLVPEEMVSVLLPVSSSPTRLFPSQLKTNPPMISVVYSCTINDLIQLINPLHLLPPRCIPDPAIRPHPATRIPARSRRVCLTCDTGSWHGIDPRICGSSACSSKVSTHILSVPISIDPSVAHPLCCHARATFLIVTQFTANLDPLWIIGCNS